LILFGALLNRYQGEKKIQAICVFKPDTCTFNFSSAIFTSHVLTTRQNASLTALIRGIVHVLVKTRDRRQNLSVFEMSCHAN